MNPYPKYKDSGEQWLGQIPEHWKMRRLKYVLQLRKKIVGSDAKKYDLLSLTLKGVIKRDIENPTGKFPTTFDSYQEVNENDFIFCNFDNEETPRAVGLSPYRGMITGAYDVLRRIDEQCNDRFLLYYFLWVDDAKRFKPLYKGLRKTIPLDSFLSYKLALPPKEEQEAMVAYLDEQTAQIDSAIAREQKMIDLLEERKQIIIQQAVTKGLNPNAKMKDSGIDWIGEIPEGWQVRRIKFILYELKNKSIKGEELALSLTKEYGLIPSSQKENRTMESESLIGYKIIHKGEIVFNRFRARLFAVSSYEGVVSPDYAVYSCNDITDAEYMVNLFNTPLYREAFHRKASGIGDGFSRLYTDDLFSMYAIYPPLEEQQAIVEYLKGSLSSINKAIAAKNRVITLLQERKQIIINEVVTGKIKVS